MRQFTEYFLIAVSINTTETRVTISVLPLCKAPSGQWSLFDPIVRYMEMILITYLLTYLPVVSLVLIRLDYGNSVLLAGLPVYLVRRLQSVLNAAGRLIQPHL